MEEGKGKRLLTEGSRQAAAAVAVAVGMIHILNVTGVLAMSTLTLRVIHLTAMLVIAFLGGKKKAENYGGMLLNVVLAFTTVSCGIYLLGRWQDISASGGMTNQIDVWMGILMVMIVLEATRRTAGTALALIALAFLAYPFVASWMPGVLRGRSYSVERIFSFLYTTTEGIFGTPLGVSATYIVMFCIYGAFLSEFGAGEFLFKLSSSLTRKFVAATAKTAIIFNLFIGMISGSAAGNVAITGTLTIPMMEKRGYSKEKAGAITAVAATGAQLMPPVMGAAAFIMAEITGFSYISIMKAAILPAILYFGALIIICSYEAKKGKFDIYSEDMEVQNIGKVLTEGWYYLVPIVALVALLFKGYSPFKAAYYSSLLLVAVYLAAGVFQAKTVSVFLVKDLLLKIINSIKKGAKDTSSLAIACAASGIIVGVLSISGLGSKLSVLIVSASFGNVLAALILTMVVSIILGMGLPTTAAYLVLASVIVPALVPMGIPLLPAHLFVFFFGCVSTITPPVALASYVAAGIANADLNKVGWTAFRYGLVSFVLPYMFIYSPSLLMEGSVIDIARTMFFSFIGVFGIAIAIAGYFRMDMKLVSRILMFMGGILLIDDGLITDLVGLAILGVILTENIRSSKKEMKQAEG